MRERFTSSHVAAWRRDGGVLIENFFTPQEVAAVQRDFETVFGPPKGLDAPLVRPTLGAGSFNDAQFTSIRSPPFHCSAALNLVGVHPALIALARAALETEDVYAYQIQAWAKFTGAADYEQPFHCDFPNHTLVAPADDARDNSVTIICYFTDVTEAHGPMHYVPRPDSAAIAGPEETFGDPEAMAALHRRLAPFARSSAAKAGSIFPYTIDVYHRGTNLTAPRGYRYAVMTCFKRAGNDAIAFHAWPFHQGQPWGRIFKDATPDQLSCFGVPRPGHAYWTSRTLRLAKARFPEWDLGPYTQEDVPRSGCAAVDAAL